MPLHTCLLRGGVDCAFRHLEFARRVSFKEVHREEKADPAVTASAERPPGGPADVAAAAHLLINESVDEVTK